MNFALENFSVSRPSASLARSAPALGGLDRVRVWRVAANLRRFERSGESGFSLLELLVVIAIVALLATFAVPGISAIASSRGITQATYEINSMLELARSEATSRQTYVWVGFQPVTNNQNLDLAVGLVCSRDGSPETTSTNLLPLSRVVTIQRVGLLGFDQLNSATRGLTSNAVTPLNVSTNNGVNFSNGATSFSSAHTITFTPRGEAMLRPSPSSFDGFDQNICVGLRKSRGTQLPVGDDDAAVLLDGSTGISRILRVN